MRHPHSNRVYVVAFNERQFQDYGLQLRLVVGAREFRYRHARAEFSAGDLVYKYCTNRFALRGVSEGKIVTIDGWKRRVDWKDIQEEIQSRCVGNSNLLYEEVEV